MVMGTEQVLHDADDRDGRRVSREANGVRGYGCPWGAGETPTCKEGRLTEQP